MASLKEHFLETEFPFFVVVSFNVSIQQQKKKRDFKVNRKKVKKKRVTLVLMVDVLK